MAKNPDRAEFPPEDGLAAVTNVAFTSEDLV